MQREIASRRAHGVQTGEKGASRCPINFTYRLTNVKRFVEVSISDFNHPLVVKAMLIEMSGEVLFVGISADGTITEDDAVVLESLNLSEAQRSV